MRAILDPRLNPRLTPAQWEAARRRRNWILGALGALLALLFAAAGYAGYQYSLTLDKTRAMQPEQVVEAAGMALAKAQAYRFSVRLAGESPDGYFPAAVMKGVFQRKPLLLHLVGEAGSGETKVPLEYYLEGPDLFVKNPRSGTWLLLANADLEELYAFQPESLAAPLVTGLRRAEVIGRERLPGGEALLLALDLDPKIMRIQTADDPDERVEYRLWVYTRTLMPAQFGIDVSRTGAGAGEATRQTTGFHYLITWDFSKVEPLSVPQDVRQQASDS